MTAAAPSTDVTRRALPWRWILVLTALGLVLRLLTARGSLWLDEAWSAEFARQAGTPAGVLLNINHDNNHILNTLWLQLLGPAAPVLAQRALPVVCGTATVVLAALWGARRGATAAIAAAMGAAVAPILVTYGSEARGYAPMLLAGLALLWLVDRRISNDVPVPAIGSGLIALAGTLAHPMMVVFVGAALAWVVWDGWRTGAVAGALRGAGAVLPALIGAAVVIGVMVFAASRAPGGYTIGSYTPFGWAGWADALNAALGFTLGLWRMQDAVLPVAVGALTTAVLWLRRGDPRTPLYALLILGFPLAVAVLRVGNAGIARYYLPSVLALVLFAGDVAEATPARRRVWVLTAVIALAALRLDFIEAVHLRADPGAAVAAMRRSDPHGATVSLTDARFAPVLRSAAVQAEYPLRLTTSCAPFLIVPSDRPTPAPPTILRRCGGYRRIASATVTGLSGTNWWLYRAD